MLAGLALVYFAARNAALTAGFFGATRPLSYSGPPPVFAILQLISLPAIPLGILVGLLGLLILLRASSVARWGVGLAAVATFFLVIDPFTSYLFLVARHDPSPGYSTIRIMFFLSYALSILSSLLLAAGLGLLFLAAHRDQRLGGWRVLLPAIAIVGLLSSVAPFALSAEGLAGGTALSTACKVVIGFLWVALGVALWRHTPNNQPVRTTPQIS